MKYLLIVLVCMSGMSGCSLISITQGDGSGKKPIPMKPQISRRMQETIRQEAQLAYDAASKVYSEGTEAKSRESRILLRAADKVLTFTGKPAEPIMIPTPDQDQEEIEKSEREIEKLHDEFERQLNESRDTEREWENEIMALKEERQALTEDRDKWKLSFANLKFWFWVLIAVIVGLCIVFPSLIPIFFKWGKKGISSILELTKRQMREVVQSVEKIRDDDTISEDVKKKIDEHLMSKQSSDTQAEIAKVKKELGI